MHLHVRSRVYLYWYHFRKSWQEHSVKKIHHDKVRRQPVLERLDKILHFNPCADAGKTMQHEDWAFNSIALDTSALQWANHVTDIVTVKCVPAHCSPHRSRRAAPDTAATAVR